MASGKKPLEIDMALSERENYLRNVRFQGPEWMPCRVAICDASWDQWRGEMEEVVMRHPRIFPDFKPGERDFDSYRFPDFRRAGERFKDAWGCVWECAVDGIVGIVVEHPISSWDKLDSYIPPDAEVQWDRGPADWDGAKRSAERARAEGKLVTGGFPHGFLFMRLYYLRGFENFMIDVATGDGRLERLIEIVQSYNRTLLRKWLDIGVDVMVFGDDLGAQRSSILSPEDFRRWIAPGYRELMEPCRRAGVEVYLHSDGHILELMDDIISSGVTIVNPQDLVNGIEELEREVKGRVCIDLDVDRQSVVPYGSRAEIRELIEEEVKRLGSPKGGLSLICGIYPPTPPENVDALCSAMEEFQTYWFSG